MLRWALTVVTVLLLAVWLASGCVSASWFSRPMTSGEALVAVIVAGLVGGGVVADPEPPGTDVETVRFDLALWPVFTWSPGDRVIAVPIWILALVSGPLATRAWVQRWRMLRRPDACPTCGYDLTGLPKEAQPRKCPECGA